MKKEYYPMNAMRDVARLMRKEAREIIEMQAEALANGRALTAKQQYRVRLYLENT